MRVPKFFYFFSEKLYYVRKNEKLPKTDPHHIVAKEGTPAKPLTCKAFFFYLLRCKSSLNRYAGADDTRVVAVVKHGSRYSSVAAWDSE